MAELCPEGMDFVSAVREVLQRFSFPHHGFAKLERPLSMDIYRQWLQDGQHAGMDYLERHADQKEDPSRFAPKAKSAIVIAQPYLPHPYPSPQRSLRTALYARGADYHDHFRAQLSEVAGALKTLFSSHEFLCFTDSAPILERDLAFRAGLGWIGKNTCVIHPKHGSLFFLGEILTSLDLSADGEPVADFCGTCTRCLDACPTGALTRPRNLDARLCISYWTIEARTPAPEPLRTKLGDWFFGCDICQTVCPWNEKAHGKSLMTELTGASEPPLAEDLRFILTASHKHLAREFAGTPLERARPLGLKRNALIVIGNRRLADLRPEVESCLSHEGLKEVAAWALAQLP